MAKLAKADLDAEAKALLLEFARVRPCTVAAQGPLLDALVRNGATTHKVIVIFKEKFGIGVSSKGISAHVEKRCACVSS